MPPSRKRKLPDYGDRCRLCLANEPYSEIVAEWMRPMIEDLQACTKLEIVDNPNYPKRVCYVCLYKLEMWNDFKTQFIKINKKLDSHFKVTGQTNEPDIAAIAENTADELILEKNEKRPKLDIKNVSVEIKALAKSPLKNLQKSPSKDLQKSPLKDLQKSPIVKIMDIKQMNERDLAKLNENKNASVSKSQASDTSIATVRKIVRNKKTEREAFTKRWVERKNALIAATGEVPTESDSESDSQLSPVQKARAKVNTEKELLEKRRKLQKALKNLQTDLTEKYRVNPEVVIDQTRKTRSGKPVGDELQEGRVIKPSLVKIERMNEKNVNDSKVTKEVEKNIKETEEDVTLVKEVETQPVEKERKEDKQAENIEKSTNMEVDETQTIDITTDTEKQLETVKEAERQPEVEENDIEIIEVIRQQQEPNLLKKKENTTQETNVCAANKKDEVVKQGMDVSSKGEDNSLTSQTLSFEVALGNATYIFNTALGFPDSTSSFKSDISLKANGTTINATTQDGKKIDISSAAQLQKLQSMEADSKIDKANNETTNVQKCLKIEVEGTETKELQRMQHNLAQFVNEDIRNRVLNNVLTKTDKKTKANNSSESLDNQLKSIIEKVLKNNLDADSSIISSEEISARFIKAAETSAVFQPKVTVSRLNIAEVCKLYKINNLRILEDAKRQRGLVGPLSRTLGKRRLVLPKKFEDFTLSFEERSTTPLKLSKSTTNNTASKSSNTSINKTQNNVHDKMATESTSKVVEEPSLEAEKVIIRIDNVPGRTTPEILPVVIDKPSVEEKSKTVQEKPSLVTEESKIVTGKQSIVIAKPQTLTEKIQITSETTQKEKTLIVEKSVLAKDPVKSPSSMVVEKVTGSLNKPTKINVITKSMAVNNVPSPKMMSNSPQIKSVDKGKSGTPENSIIASHVASSKSMDIIKVISPKPKANINRSVPIKPKRLSDATMMELTNLNKPSQTTAKETDSISKKSLIDSNPLKSQLPSLATASRASTTVNNTNTKRVSFSSTISTTTLSPPSVKTSPTSSKQMQRHICGICRKQLFSKEEAEAHVKNHKEQLTKKTSPLRSPISNSSSSSSQQSLKPKPKLMRCKRCQAIVEAAYVKTHICNSIKFNCHLCDCTFGAEHLLVEHLDTHSQNKRKDSSKPSTATKKGNLVKEKRVVIQKDRSNLKTSEVRNQENLEDILADKEPQGYSCFVCDKIFVDEEQMKDHLQMHCEEVSDDGNDKGFQCAFCREKFQTEESLETHVGNHLLEDGDEKINLLINLETRRDRQRRTLFKCDQCDETFNSSLLLAMHLPLHEEEEADMLAEYETQEGEVHHHVCTICDEIFENAEELSEHLDVHNGNSHVCILCEKPFSSIRDLQDHVSTHL